MAHWASGCHHALLWSQPWASHPKGEWNRGAWGFERKKGGGDDGMEEKEEEYIRRGVEREKGCGLSPGCWPSHPPLFHSISPSIQPLLGCLLLHNGCFSAEISRYWIPSLEFCPPTMSRQQSMLQGKHTLQAKSWKTIPSFISIRKTPPPPHSCFPSFLPPYFSFYIKTGGSLSSLVKLH